MRKARLLFTEDCLRNCKGCCNKNWKGKPAVGKTIEELREYDEIYITGGEPMLYVDALMCLIKMLRTSTNKIFLYTAMPYPQYEFIPLLLMLDGCTVTIHNYADRQKFIRNMYYKTMFAGKSMRLNVFPKGKFVVDESWDVRQKVWITDTPLPEGEEFVTAIDYKIGRNG